MRLFAIADLHLSFGVKKPMDIFRGWENYEEKIEKNWKSAVTDDDTVIIAGDISWGMTLEESLPDFKFIDTLPGKKIILKGNHDYWWTTLKKMNEFLCDNGIKTVSFLHNNAFQFGDYAICGTRGWVLEKGETEDKKVTEREAGRLARSLEEGKKLGLELIVFLHYPPFFGDYVCSEIIDVLKKFEVKRCYFGHIHGQACRLADRGVQSGIKCRLISADFVEFHPILVE